MSNLRGLTQPVVASTGTSVMQGTVNNGFYDINSSSQYPSGFYGDGTYFIQSNNQYGVPWLTESEIRGRQQVLANYTYDSKYTPAQNAAVSRLKGQSMRLAHPHGYSAYIKNEVTGKKIQLATTPTSHSESVSVNSSSESPLGSSQPYVIYTSTAAREVSLTFDVSLDYLPKEYDSLYSYVRDLKQLCYPKYSGSNIIPPECSFYIGNIDANPISIIGMPKNVDVSWGSTFRDGAYDFATISIAITETKKVVDGKVNM